MKAYWSNTFSLGNCQQYLKRYRQKRPKLKLKCPNDCCCGQTMHGHGRYFRMALFKHRYFRVPIYRWCCPNCGQTFSVLPDFLSTKGHFALPVREAALKRKASGESWQKIMDSIAEPGGISRKTVKRWWMRHLHKAASAAQWLAAELIRSGVNEDLLRLHTGGINPTPLDTLHWFTTLARKYLSLLGLNPNPLRGFFGFLNTKLPDGKLV